MDCPHGTAISRSGSRGHTHTPTHNMRTLLRPTYTGNAVVGTSTAMGARCGCTPASFRLSARDIPLLGPKPEEQYLLCLAVGCRGTCIDLPMCSPKPNIDPRSPNQMKTQKRQITKWYDKCPNAHKVRAQTKRLAPALCSAIPGGRYGSGTTRRRSRSHLARSRGAVCAYACI